VCAALGLKAQNATTNGPVRSITLDESIRLALEHNLDLALQRAGPQRARYVIQNRYGSYYDPALTLSGQQRFNTQPGTFNPLINNVVSASETWRESFSSEVNGRLPSGLTYDLTSSLNRTSGKRFDTDSNSFVNRDYIYDSAATATFTQPLLRDFWTDAGRTDIKVAKKDLKISEFLLQFTVMDTLNKVAAAYYDLIAARDNIGVQEAGVELAERLVAENKKKVEVGTLAPLDEKQAESQAAAAKAALTDAVFKAQQAENVLKGLISDNFSSFQPVTLAPAEKLVALSALVNVAESWQNALKLRPDYAQLREEVEKQDIMLKYRRNQLYPYLNLQGSVGRQGLGGSVGDAVEDIRGGQNPNWGGGAVLIVPFTFATERSAYKATKIDKETAFLKFKQREELILRNVDDAVKRVRSSYEATISTREARVYAEQALDAEQKKLDNGKSTSFQVLQLQKDLTQARSNEIKALADYNKALQDFYFQEGTTLQHNKVNLEVK